MKTIRIGGMSCGHCVAAVTKALSSLPGVGGVKVDLEKGEASFSEELPIERAVIAEAIRKAGYEIL